MKLSINEAEEISRLYNLGKIKKLSLIKGGAVNYNYNLSTDKGKFIIRILGKRMDGWKKGRLDLEFKTLNFLKDNNFPYEIPQPIKSKNKEILTSIHGRTIWIYRRLEGQIAKNINIEQMKEIARAIAIYHRLISKIKIKKKRLDDSWAIKALEKAKRVNLKNKSDINFILNCLKKVKCYNFDENILITHSDFNRSNLLFKGNKLIGILDFDNLQLAPRIKDIAYAVRRFCYIKGKYNVTREKLFLREYEKINKLSRKEKEMILEFMLRDCCIFFWWASCEMKKTKHKKQDYLKEAISMARKLEKRLK